jgi:nucleoside-diphosphate-sugar epimerase
MKILVTGNLGYIGPVLGKVLRRERPDWKLVGLDTGLFQGCLVDPSASPDGVWHTHLYKDVRAVAADDLRDVDAVIHLAAVSNDPMGKQFEKATFSINSRATVELAKLAKKCGVKSFVFASSCSVYGDGAGETKSEASGVNPLTAYAKTKLESEEGLQPLASPGFKVTAFRFATACGPSPRVRLDLVLNDFVASALLGGRIDILSDGTPLRPLISTRDMSRLLMWGAERSRGDDFLVLNGGCDEWNFSVREIADAVAARLKGVAVSVNPAAPADKRSYKVDFAKLREIAPAYYPRSDFGEVIAELAAQLKPLCASGGVGPAFRDSHFVRLKVLTKLIETKSIDSELRALEA